jgi:spore coat protein A
MDIKKWTPTRRQLLKAGLIGGAGMMLPLRFKLSKAHAVALDSSVGLLSDPALEAKFVNPVPDALNVTFKYGPAGGPYTVGVGTGFWNTGHSSGNSTAIFGYGQGGVYTWPGKTFEVASGATTTVVNWQNNLFGVTQHLLPVDTSLHWCYSLPNYDTYTIENQGIPIITHLHGGHSDFQYDGNPEFFFTPGNAVVGPQWANVPGGFTNTFVYDNDVPAGNLWYHDHALGITRLNVYAGMAGFYFVRDEFDPGTLIAPGPNDLGLPKHPYELALAIQDRMFTTDGQLFYPAFPGDPFYADFITGEGAILPDPPFTGGGPTALAEFFGDHMVVNGVLWPKANVQPRNYRMRILNGCDSRFMALRFRVARRPNSTDLKGAGAPLPFYVVGSDQGLAAAATQTDTLLSEPGGRYDVVFDFKGLQGQRIIMENIASDAPFGGKIGGGPSGDFFPDRQTDRIMAFDVADSPDVADEFDPTNIGQYGGNNNPVSGANPRRVALFEGTDEFGRLQPLLGVAEPTVDVNGDLANGTIAWHSATTENPALNTTEIWEIYNATGDAHPIHLHLVNFEILDRQKFRADLIPQPVVQHNGTLGQGFSLANIRTVGRRTPAEGVEKAPKDMVTALPGEVTRIKATFDKPGRYVWHCHILSHEDHEMMRVLQVG